MHFHQYAFSFFASATELSKFFSSAFSAAGADAAAGAFVCTGILSAPCPVAGTGRLDTVSKQTVQVVVSSPGSVHVGAFVRVNSVSLCTCEEATTTSTSKLS